MKKYIKPIIKVFNSAMGLMSASGGGHNGGLTHGGRPDSDNNGIIKGGPTHGGEDEL